VFTYFGDWIRKRIIHRFFPPKEGEEKPHTKFRDFIIKHGLEGIAFLTPLFLTPIGGTILAVSMGNPKGKIILYMLISALGWALVFTAMIYSVGPSLINMLKKLDIFNY